VIDPGSARLALVVAADQQASASAATAIADGWRAARREVVDVAAPPAAAWPFNRPLPIALPAALAIIWMPDIHEAFINHQTASTRLVTTQPAYLLLSWFATVGDADILLLATADKATLGRHAPEVLACRGPFGQAFIYDAEHDRAPSGTPKAPEARQIVAGSAEALLAAAMRAAAPAERLRLCVAALEQGRTPPALVATASACMEVNDLDAAARDLDEALAHAPDWAAAHFERGKLWLRLDDLEQAADCFRTAAERMPDFASAWANLGATLGELDRPDEALRAFEQALRADPLSHQALNNIGVVSRELGRLGESEAAFRRVTELAPDLAFGYYNLGHTLFLQGRYRAALAAYIAGQQRDPERNAVQATRLAMCRLAAGDAGGAVGELEQATRGLPREYAQQLLADTNAIAWALLTHRPDLPGWKQVNDWLTGERAKYT
jgi:tetratricopeptide (TPR) repeat protein